MDVIYYDKDLQLLGIHFKKSDVTWIYRNVPANTYGELLSSPSTGSYFMRNIRDKFDGEKIKGSFYAKAKKEKKIQAI